MDWLFDADKPLMRGLSAIADLLILNLLTILCSIPVITAGPAIIALFTTAIRMVRNEDGSLVRDYFRAFSANLKLGILFWILLLICMGLLYFDYLAAQAYAPVMSPVIAAMGVLVLAVSFYIFGLLARYADTLSGSGVLSQNAGNDGVFHGLLGAVHPVHPVWRSDFADVRPVFALLCLCHFDERHFYTIGK